MVTSRGYEKIKTQQWFLDMYKGHTHEFTAAVAAHPRPSPEQTSQHSSMQSEGIQELAPLSEDLQMVGGFLGEEKKLSLRLWFLEAQQHSSRWFHAQSHTESTDSINGF